MQRLGYSMPLGILAVLAVYFLLGLGRDPYILVCPDQYAGCSI